MPAVLQQIDQMSASEKMRLMAYLVKSISTVVENQAVAERAPCDVRFGCPRPVVSDFVGYCQKFNHETRSTDEIMNELREGEA